MARAVHGREEQQEGEKMTVSRSLAFSAAFSAVACVPPPGTQLGDMSAAGHLSAAYANEAKARYEAQLYDSSARETIQIDLPYTDANGMGYATTPQVINPTDIHRESSWDHWANARKHRAAYDALVESEAEACQELPESARAENPFVALDIVAVTRFEAKKGGIFALFGKRRSAGARLLLRPRQGQTEQRIKVLLECHRARSAVLGHDTPEMPESPLVPAGAGFEVRSEGELLVLDVTADEPSVADEIWGRAQRLR